MSRLIGLLSGLLVLFALAGLSSPAAATGPAAVAGPAATPAGPQDAAYRLGPTDKVRVMVFGEEQLTGEFVVASNGTISYPLLGEVRAQGLTPRELQLALETRLAEGYLRTPRVAIEVLTYRPFYILGEVNKPGEYPYSAGLTVLKAVATAQGFTYRANKRKVFVRRAGETAEQKLGLTGSTTVQPGDTIRIAERYF
jgi:polysaccharide export outer membrane protein